MRPNLRAVQLYCMIVLVRLSAIQWNQFADMVQVASLVSIIFGRSVLSVVYGCIGAIASLEAFNAAQKKDKSGVGRVCTVLLILPADLTVLQFAVFLALNAIASLTIGFVLISGVSINCFSAANTQNCAVNARIYGYFLLILTASSVSVVNLGSELGTYRCAGAAFRVYMYCLPHHSSGYRG